MGSAKRAINSRRLASEAAPAAESIWFFKNNNLVMKEGVEINADRIVDAAVDYAAAQARAHQGGALTDPMVAEWLGQGVAKAIARFVLAATDRMKKRTEVMVRTPRPTPAEIAFNRLENERDQAELAQLLGDPQAPVRIPSAVATKSGWRQLQTPSSDNYISPSDPLVAWSWFLDLLWVVVVGAPDLGLRD